MKLNIGVVFGGASVEHEISIISASQVMAALDEEKYNVLPIYISKDKDFYFSNDYRNVETFQNLEKAKSNGTQITLKKDGLNVEMHYFNKKMFTPSKMYQIDIFFPVLHGTNGEDGTIQGMFEMLDATFTGCECKGAVNGQDKVFMKNILRDNNIRVVDFDWFYSNEFYEQEEEIIKRIETKLFYPVIVKPASLGSSVGISKANNKDELADAIREANRYDVKILVEKVVDNLVEVNCAVLGDYSSQKASVIEQVFQNDEILSYEDKYQGGGSKKTSGGSKTSEGMASVNRLIPAPLSEEKTTEIQEMSKAAFRALSLAGDTRIDYLIDGRTNTVYLNEVNTIPGSLAFYLWDKVDIDFTKLCDEMIMLAVKRKRESKQHTTSFETNVLQSFGQGSKGSKK
ncbi:D-alanine--D-alanine ligase family protein [Mycoplasma sp. P36-A1]|uniref:D-alanine--D-alanine ligase family protein n=1 Tax=Mycoplasma sp. P36-A1 TaxID=3252900 RepID=UPI003C2EDB72